MITNELRVKIRIIIEVIIFCLIIVSAIYYIIYYLCETDIGTLYTTFSTECKGRNKQLDPETTNKSVDHYEKKLKHHYKSRAERLKDARKMEEYSHYFVYAMLGLLAVGVMIIYFPHVLEKLDALWLDREMRRERLRKIKRFKLWHALDKTHFDTLKKNQIEMDRLIEKFFFKGTGKNRQLTDQGIKFIQEYSRHKDDKTPDGPPDTPFRPFVAETGAPITTGEDIGLNPFIPAKIKPVRK
jgi:hypothetical protein